MPDETLPPHFIVVIGASAGGLQSVIELMAAATTEMNAAVLVVLHSTSGGNTDVLIQRLQKHTVFTCKMAEHNEQLQPRHLYLAVPDRHLLVKDGHILLGQGPIENRWRPSIDVLFRSAAVAYNSRVIGIILTGMLDDGTTGMQMIKECGGTCIVQDPAEAEYPDMPASVLRRVEVDYCTSLQRIGIVLQEKTRNGVPAPHLIPPAIAKEAQIAERVSSGIADVASLGGFKSDYSCPDCGGGLWEIQQGGITRFRCHTGHMYTIADLNESKRKELEETFWVAMRILEERKNLLHKMAEEETSKGWLRSATSKTDRAEELELHINRLKEMLFTTTGDANSQNLPMENR